MEGAIREQPEIKSDLLRELEDVSGQLMHASQFFEEAGYRIKDLMDNIYRQREN